MKCPVVLCKCCLGIIPALVSLGVPAEPDVRPGLWESTISIQVPGMPMTPPPSTQRYCITKADLVPQDPASNSDCQRLDHKIEGNTVTWSAECKHAGGNTIGSGKITYAGDTYQGGMEMLISNESGKDLKMTQTMHGHRIGDCAK